ncbi:MAG: TraB/GumN family protein [Gemmatimonadetes bacterium]|nr:TraB/GumN family protein [Gemmatimonadota bacterium]
MRMRPRPDSSPLRAALAYGQALVLGVAFFVAIRPLPVATASAQVAELGLTLDTTTAEAAVETARTAPLAHSLLWKITRPDIAHASYLYGTVHIIPVSRFKVPGRLLEALEQTDRIVFEFNMGDEDFSLNAGREMRLEPGTTLPDLYSDEQFGALAARVQEDYGFDLALVGTMKPFYLIPLLGRNLIGEPVTSYERYLFDYANEHGVAIGGLEDVQRQFAVVNAIPLAEQADMLAELIEEPDEAKAMFRNMYDAYDEQDLARIHTFFLESPEMKKYHDLLLVNRNHAWIPAIAKHHEEGRSFIACGAGHFAGEDGLIRLLRDAGFTVVPE